MKYLVVGIGNRTGGDDAVGLYVIDKLKQKKCNDIDGLDIGIYPENYTDVMKKKRADVLILVDAVDMGLKAGEIRRVLRHQIGEMHVSTHGIPLSVLMKYLETYIRHVVLIGIQPGRLQGKMSKVIQKSADIVVENINSKNVEKFSILS
jgi:hydrogenase 3 maturation protease